MKWYLSHLSLNLFVCVTLFTLYSFMFRPEAGSPFQGLWFRDYPVVARGYPVSARQQKSRQTHANPYHSRCRPFRRYSFFCT